MKNGNWLILGRQRSTSRGEGATGREGAQGHDWTETWTACRSAPALSSECEEGERERE